MKRYFWLLLWLILSARLSAQTNLPVKLALISESDEATIAGDLLTARLSGNSQVRLLERDQIDKIWREQGQSAANRDDLKLGRMLGADGLLMLNVVRTRQATNLMVRLIAVKPGVVLRNLSFLWPLNDPAPWADSIASHVAPLLPKLAVLAQDAVPLSVVNLRSAIASGDAAEIEREIKLLTIQRLSQERQLFVLERQKMQQLSNEKELNADESAFWNGGYLLEGVVDQGGYSVDVVTINARLTPPNGGAPLEFEVSGFRTNLAAVVNQLAVKTIELLKVNSTVKEWNTADEARQYFKEAQWALRWGASREAQEAADAAWALGKHDLDCAEARVKAYLLQLSSVGGEFNHGEISVSSNDDGSWWLKRLAAEDHAALIIKRNAVKIDYATIDSFPDPVNLDCAIHALELYADFSRNSPEGQPKVQWRGAGWNDWHNSEWYNLGLEDLTAASKVLQHFNLVPRSQGAVLDKLADLRAAARSVAALLNASPTIHDSYFVGSRVATYDELDNTMGKETIFSCEVKWGALWQETPTDCLILYRDLLSSPVFCYIHTQFWLRRPDMPRLVAWNESDRHAIPALWDRFVGELDSSTNLVLRMEGKALAVADAKTDAEWEAGFSALMADVSTNRAELVANNVDMFYLEWRLHDLLIHPDEGYTETPILERMLNEWRTNYCPRLDAMERDYREQADQRIKAAKFLPVFEQQKQYLRENRPYEFLEFVHTFEEQDYSKDQAREIGPLLAAYRSNLVAQSQNASGIERSKLMGGVSFVGFRELVVSNVINPPISRPMAAGPAQPVNPTLAPVPVAKPIAAAQSAQPTESITNIMTVTEFLPIPMDGLPGDQKSGLTVVAHHLTEGRLLLDIEYGAMLYAFDDKGNWQQTRNVTLSGIALLEPETKRWTVASCPEVDLMAQSHFYHRSALLRGKIFTSDGGKIEKYDPTAKGWKPLPVSDGNNYELFSVNGHLYAANGEIISEISDDQKSTRILASKRRNPPASVLDGEDFGTPTLFGGPNQSLRASTPTKIFTWTGNDWHEDATMPASVVPPLIFSGGVLFRSSSESWGRGNCLLRLLSGALAPELCLDSKAMPDSLRGLGSAGKTNNFPAPLWRISRELAPQEMPAILCESNLYLLAGHNGIKKIANVPNGVGLGEATKTPQYNARMVCFSPGIREPQMIYMNFAVSGACPPQASFDPDAHLSLPSLSPGMMELAGTNLLIAYESPVNISLPRRLNRTPRRYECRRMGAGQKPFGSHCCQRASIATGRNCTVCRRSGSNPAGFINQIRSQP